MQLLTAINIVLYIFTSTLV